MLFRWSGWSLSLTILGLVVVALALIWLLVIFPIMAKLPVDYEREYMFEGSIMQLNQETMSLDATPTSIERLLQATGTEDDVLLLQQDISFYVAGTDILLEDVSYSELLGVDRTTRENVSGYGDMDRSGQFTFPSGVEKKSYNFWSSSVMSPLPAQYISEGEFKGLLVYSFKIDVQGIDLGLDEATGLPRTMDVLTELKVEPISGVPVDTATTTTVNMNMGQGPMPVYINTMSFTDDTITDMVDTADGARSLILWATVYGFWIAIGLGAALMLGGLTVATKP